MQTVKLPRTFIRETSWGKNYIKLFQKKIIAVVNMLINRPLENCFQSWFGKRFSTFVSNTHNNQIKSRGIKSSKSYWTEILFYVVSTIRRRKINQKGLKVQPRRCFSTTSSWKLWESECSPDRTLSLSFSAVLSRLPNFTGDSGLFREWGK